MTRIADKEYEKVETPVIGNRYHVAWAWKGCNWKLISIDIEKGTCTLHATKSNKTLDNIKIEDLRQIRKNEKQQQ